LPIGGHAMIPVNVGLRAWSEILLAATEGMR